MNKDFKDKSDAELIEIRNNALTHSNRDAAEIELHSRQKKTDLSTNKMTFWILIFTSILVVLGFFTFIIVLEHRTSMETKPKQSTVIEPFTPRHDTSQNSQKPKNNKYDKDHR
jgi:hypothetical protein